MDLTPLQLIFAALAAFLVGFTKTGLTGMGVLIVPLLASIFPGKGSVGVLLPMLIFADLFAVAYHHKNAQWRLLARLLPWVLPGMALGYFALQRIPDRFMGKTLGILVLLMVALRIVQERGNRWLVEHVPRQWWFSAAMGIMAGFATTLGNLAGTIMSIYLLSMGFDKHRFMGTGAWYYLIVNALKVPLNVHLGLIATATLAFNLKSAPLIVIGAGLGILAFRKMPQEWFNRAIVVLATLAALRLIFL